MKQKNIHSKNLNSKNTMKRITFLLSLACISIISACQNEKHHVEEESTFLVTKPIEKDTIIYNEYVGQLEAIQHIEVRALEKGYLQKIYVEGPVQNNEKTKIENVVWIITTGDFTNGKKAYSFDGTFPPYN